MKLCRGYSITQLLVSSADVDVSVSHNGQRVDENGMLTPGLMIL